MNETHEPFRFVTHLTLTELTGHKARDLQELVAYLKTAPLPVIYYHTHHFLEQHHYLSPEPPNDFAFWVSGVLKEDRLGERLAAIDTIQFSSLTALRETLVSTISRHLESSTTLRTAPDGNDFYLMSSRSFVLPTPYEARDLAEFGQALRKVSIHSLYHHIFEARLRLERGNDFALWLDTALGEKKLAWQITYMDPYTQTMEGLRQRILKLIDRRLAEKEKDHVAA